MSSTKVYPTSQYDVDSKSILKAAVNEAFKDLNCKRTLSLNCFKPNAVRPIQDGVTKEFVTSCPLIKSTSMPDLKSIHNDVMVQQRVRRRGVSERCEDDRVIFKYALKNYSTIAAAKNYHLM